MPVSTVTTSTHVTVSVPPAPQLTPLMFGGVVMRPEAGAYDESFRKWAGKFTIDLSAFAAAISAQLASIINTSGGQAAIQAIQIANLQQQFIETENTLVAILAVLSNWQAISVKHGNDNPNTLLVVGNYDGQMYINDTTQEKWNWDAKIAFWI